MSWCRNQDQEKTLLFDNQGDTCHDHFLMQQKCSRNYTRIRSCVVSFANLFLAEKRKRRLRRLQGRLIGWELNIFAAQCTLKRHIQRLWQQFCRTIRIGSCSSASTLRHFGRFSDHRLSDRPGTGAFTPENALAAGLKAIDESIYRHIRAC